MDKEKYDLNLDFFLKLIPKGIHDYPGESEEISCNESFLNSDVQGQLFSETYTFTTDSSSALPNVCAAQMEVDWSSSDDPYPEFKNLSDFPKSSKESQKCAHCRILKVQCLETFNSLIEKCRSQGLKFHNKSGDDHHTLCSSNEDDTSNEESERFENCAHYRIPKIQCLETFDSLIEKCRSQGLKFHNKSGDAAYDVDIILTHKVVEKSVNKYETYYWVKWKNYHSDFNTWEPECHLKGCYNSIKYYYAMKCSKSVINKKLIEYFIQDLTSRQPYDFLTLSHVCALCFNSTEKYINSLQLTIKQMKQKVKEILNFSPNKLQKLSNKLFPIMQFAESRKRVLINLKEWEDEINSRDENRYPYIFIENNVDLETAPSDFQFINDNINTTVQVPEEPVSFCHCENCYVNRKLCCPHDSDGCFAYDKNRRLILKPGYPIYECNRFCKCGPDCPNRVVQHGQKVNFLIFRTENGCGWGLKTLETIEKGQFVLEYLGEIITSEAAEARGIIYDYIERSYLFDLNYGVDNHCFTVDAGHLGNAAHFINHSCNPNLHVFAVWIENPDPRLPRLAFFAKRKIQRGEELTFDYKMVQKNRFGSQSSHEYERVLCHCNSKNCRKYLF